jgi:hypothetical protein
MFNLWARSRKPRVAVSSFLGVIALVALAFVVGLANPGNSSAKQYLVAVCHNGNTIFVNINAQSAHLSHGDTAGPCA